MTALLHLDAHLLACATCQGDAGTLTYNAQQTAIWFLLTLTMTMLGTLLLILFNFARKQRRALAAEQVAQSA